VIFYLSVTNDVTLANSFFGKANPLSRNIEKKQTTK